jgi:hypothetical protein
MAWPLSQDYNEAIQSPAANFADSELRRSTVVVNDLGLPRPFSGNFADVYEVAGPEGDRWAVKCFTREVRGLRERYQEISRFLDRVKLPFTVNFTYLGEGIRIAGRWYPVLKMQWVEGLTLNQFVSQSLDKPAMLDSLLLLWTRMANYLRTTGAAHGDLQHGNVLLVPGANANSLALKLIDYDGMCVPALATSKSGEVGHPSYQHPQRIREGTYGTDMDRFPILLVGTALRALRVKGRALWEEYDNGDNLLFRESDLTNPAQSELFDDLIACRDSKTDALTGALQMALAGRLEATPLLEEVLADMWQGPGPTRRPLASTATASLISPTPSSGDLIIYPEVVADELSPLILRKRKKRKLKKAKNPAIPAAVWIVATLMILVGGVSAGALMLKKRSNKEQEQVGVNDIPAVTDGKSSRLTQPEVQKEPRPGPPASKDLTPQAEKPDAKKTNPTTQVKRSDRRQPVPDDSAIALAEKEMRQTYNLDVANQDKESAIKLYPRLEMDGHKMKDKPAMCFVLLTQSRDLAVKAGHLWPSLSTVEQLAQYFQLDVWALKADLLEQVEGKPVNLPETRDRAAALKEHYRNVAAYALAAAESAVEADSFPAAERLAKIAQTNADRAGDKIISNQVPGLMKDFAALRTAYEPVPSALDTLVSQPDDLAANLVVGKYYALDKGDWDSALPRLGICGNQKLGALAKSDLECARDPIAMAEIGNRYAELAKTEKDAWKTHLQWRACYWYERAEGCSSGSDRTKVAATRATIEKNLPPSRPYILYAAYCSPFSFANLTDPFRRFLVKTGNPKLAFAKGVWTPFELPEPAPGERWTLIVGYRYRGRSRLSTTGDYDTVHIPAQENIDKTQPGRPEPGQELVILFAKLGVGNKFDDVTDKVQSAVKGSTIPAKPSELGLGDVTSTKGKLVVLGCLYHGKAYFSVTLQDFPILDHAPLSDP